MDDPDEDTACKNPNRRNQNNEITAYLYEVHVWHYRYAFLRLKRFVT